MSIYDLTAYEVVREEDLSDLRSPMKSSERKISRISDQKAYF